MIRLSLSRARAVCCGLFLFLFSIQLNAQFRAGIQGTILDPTGAAIPNAQVELRSEETNVTRQTTAGGEGFFRFDQLAPGRYTVTVTAEGFQKSVREHFEVRAEQLEGLNLTMQPGAVTSSVTVSADVIPQLQTENASIEGTITAREVKTLPQVGRSPYELLRLTPGVFGIGARDRGGNAINFPNNSGPGGTSFNSSIFQTENQVPVSANGQRVTANGYQIDGVNVNSQAWGGAAVITPNQESVREVHVVANSYSAENGRNSGALVQVVSQNGTNDFHGSAFWKLNRPGLNAFARWGGPHGEAPQRVDTRYNQLGGSVGGPIWKDHLFFFFSYETIRTNANSLANHWVETSDFVNLINAARPNSIASQVLGINGIAPRVANVIPRDCTSAGYLDPTQCQTLPGGLDIGSPTGGPSARVGVNGGGLDGIPDIMWTQLNIPADSVQEQYNGRIDFRPTANDLFAVSIYYVPSNNTSNSADYNGRPIEDWTSDRLNEDGAVLWNRTINPTTLNELRFNVTRWFFNEIDSNPNIPWGIPRQTVTTPQFDLNWGPPGPGVFYQTTYNVRDTLSKVINSHALKIGFDLSYEQNNDTVAWAARPTYDFGNLWNWVNDAPINENGNFDPRNGFPTDLKKYIRSGNYAIFIQDDWKARSNLTFNLGLRWEYFAPLREKYGNISNAILGTGANPLDGVKLALGGEVWGGDPNNFGPQFGAAWSPRFLKNRGVIRGGYGIGFNRVPMSRTLDGRLNPPFFGTFNLPPEQILYTLGSSLNSFYGWPSNPFTVLTFDPQTNLPIAGANLAKPDIYGVPINMATPYAQRYSLELQYDLGANWVASLGYQGSLGRKFPRTVNWVQFYSPNPLVNKVTLLRNDISSNYNALLARATHRFSRGFDLTVQYRWSKSLDTCSNDDNCASTYPIDLSQEYGPSDFDVTHSFQASGVWDLPIFSSGNPWATGLLGGWQLSGVLTASSGFPWTPTYNVPTCSTISNRGGVCPPRPVAFLGGVDYDYGNDAFKNGTNFVGGGFDYFVNPPDDYGLVPPAPGIGRNVFRGPRYFNIDLSASKRFKLPRIAFLGENAGLEIRANAFNVFNKLNFRPFQFNASNTFTNSADFGRALEPVSGRVVEFQARFSF